MRGNYLAKYSKFIRFFSGVVATCVLVLGLLGTYMAGPTKMENKFDMTNCLFRAEHKEDMNTSAPKGDSADHLEVWRSIFLVSPEDGASSILDALLIVVLGFVNIILVTDNVSIIFAHGSFFEWRHRLFRWLNIRKLARWSAMLRQGVDLLMVSGYATV